MTGVDGTAGLDQIAQPPNAHCSVDLNKGGQKPEEKTQMDGVQKGNYDREDMMQAGYEVKVPDAALEKIKSCTMQNNQKWMKITR